MFFEVGHEACPDYIRVSYILGYSLGQGSDHVAEEHGDSSSVGPTHLEVQQRREGYPGEVRCQEPAGNPADTSKQNQGREDRGVWEGMLKRLPGIPTAWFGAI